MEVTGQTTFSQIYNEMRSKPLNRDTQIRGTDDGTQLYVHHALKAHGRGAEAALQRAHKEERGGEMIRQAIDREFGPGWANRVLNHININQGVDLSGSLKRSDLGTLHTAITELRTADQHTLEHGTVAEKLNLLAQRPFDATSAQALVTLAQDATLTAPQRDLAMNVLQGKMMQSPPAIRERAMQTAEGRPNAPFIEALFALRLSTGARGLSVADLTTITRDQFQRETPRQASESFFRGTSVAQTLLSRGMSSLDGGHLATLGTTVNGYITQQLGLATANGVPHTIVEPVRQSTVGNPVIVNAVIGQVNTLLGQQVQTPELHTFLTGVQAGIDAGPPPGDWNGADFVKNAVVLRAFNPGIVNNTTSGTVQREIATSVTAAIQQVVNLERAFGADSRYLGLNPGIAQLLAPGNGLSHFTGLVP